MSLEDFEYGRVLGKGVFGSVLIVKRKEDKEIYAMKRVRIGGLSKRELENSFNEVRLLASLNHKNVIGYREAFYDQKSKTLNIVMEFADDGDLSTKIKQYIKKQMFFDEQTIWSTLIQILEGLKYLHKSDIIHRDLKSANIFLTKKGIVKIGDLNVSKIIGKSMAITQTGTPYYASPEIWNDHPYDYKCDIWSAGCIIYEMASLKMPFRGTSMQMLYNNVMKGDFAPIPSRYSNDLMEIIKLILTKNPRRRPSAEDLLNHRIILEKMEKIMGINFWNIPDEKAMLIRTIKLPRNINQMNLINGQLPRKNYEKDKYQNQMEMLENDEYETAKNSFYHPNSNLNEKNKYMKKKKNIHNLNDLNSLKDIYKEPNKLRTLIEKNNIERETNRTDNCSKNNNYPLNKYNYNYNYQLNNISNFNNNRKKEKEVLKNLNNYCLNMNKKEDIYPVQQISQNKKFRSKNTTTESLRISTSNIFTSEQDKEYKIPTSINEPIKLIQNLDVNNSIKNIYLKREEKNKYVPISSLNNGNSIINNLFESQIKKILNKKANPITQLSQLNPPNQIDSIPPMKYESRQRHNKFIQNPSYDNILKNKKIKTLDSQKKKIIQNPNNNNKKEIIRNKSCKGAILYNNPLLRLNEISYLEEDNLLKKKKRIKKNNVRRNISTDLLNKKNSLFNYNHNYNDNKSKENTLNIAHDNKVNLPNNNTKVKRIKKQLEDILPPFEFDKIFKNRLPSANSNNINKKNKNNVNVKININNNYNYINNLNIGNHNNANNKYVTDNQFRQISNGKNIDNNKKNIRAKSTSYNISKEKCINKPHHQMIKITNINQKENKNNITEITDNINIKNNYKDFYNIYYQKFLQDKLKNHKIPQKIVNFNKNYNINDNEKLVYNNGNNRKVIYEKISVINKKGEERKYIKGPAIVRNIGEGNMNNKCHREILKYQNLLKYNNDYSIQNFMNKDYKDDKSGPRIILPKKMMISN